MLSKNKSSQHYSCLLQTSNVWLHNMSCLHPTRTRFSLPCARLDATNIQFDNYSVGYLQEGHCENYWGTGNSRIPPSLPHWSLWAIARMPPPLHTYTIIIHNKKHWMNGFVHKCMHSSFIVNVQLAYWKRLEHSLKFYTNVVTFKHKLRTTLSFN